MKNNFLNKEKLKYLLIIILKESIFLKLKIKK